MELPLNTPQAAPDIDPAFPAHLRQQLVDTIKRNLPISDSSIAPTLSNAEPMRIELTKDVTINITRHLPLDRARVVDGIAQDYARLGATQPSTSAFNAPVVLAKKPDGSWRFCVDYRELNAITKRDAYQFPRISDMFESLAGSKYFSTIDLAAGFHQIPLHPKDRHYTAFSTLSGHWEFTRVPYGLTNSPPWMQRAISARPARPRVEHLRGLDRRHHHPLQDRRAAHRRPQRRHAALSRVSGFSVRLHKCHFGMTKIKYLGHIISADGIAKSPDNIKDIAEAQPPKTVKELQRVLGLFNYYRRFVHQFAALARPLTRYLAGSPKGSTPVTLDQARCAPSPPCAQSSSSPTSSSPTPTSSKEFVVETDASQHHIGAILSQRDEKNVERPVAFWSQTLTERQSHWSAYKRELFALISACKEWRRYLQVRRSSRPASTSAPCCGSSRTPRTSPCSPAGSCSYRSSASTSSTSPARSTNTSTPSPRAPSTATRTATAASPVQGAAPGPLPLSDDLNGVVLRRLQVYPKHVNAFDYSREDLLAVYLSPEQKELQARLNLVHVVDQFNLKDLLLAQRARQRD